MTGSLVANEVRGTTQAIAPDAIASDDYDADTREHIDRIIAANAGNGSRQAAP